MSGIYQILNTVTGHSYIGSAVRPAHRWHNHQSDLRLGKHHSPYLQRAWIKYGEAAFKFALLFECLPEELIMYEQAAMDHFKPEYNIAKVAGSQLGYKHTPETRAKLSKIHTGKRRAPLTPEHKAKLSAAHTGLKYAPQTPAQRLAKSLRQTGRKMSPEVRAARSARMMGVSYGPLSAEHRAKIGAANKGKAISSEQRAKIAAALTGRKHTPERIANQIRNHPANRK